MPVRTIYGVPGTNTLPSTFPDSYVGNLQIKGPSPWYDVKAYGALGNGVTNDTTAIQNAINAANAAGGGIVFFPPSTNPYLVTSLNLTGMSYVTLQGVGVSSKISSSSNVATTNIIDMTGAQNCLLRDFQVTTASGVTVGTGILVSSTVPNNGNAHTFQNVSVTGKFAYGGIYIYAAVSSRMISTQVTNSNLAAGVNAGCIVFTTTNISGVVSAFATIITGGQSVSDWNFFDVETHDSSNTVGGTSASSIIFDGVVTDIVWVGGNVSGSNGATAAQQLVKFNAAAQRINFTRATFYSDAGVPATNVFFINGTTTVTALQLMACSMQAVSAIFAANNTCTYDKLVFNGVATGITNIAVTTGTALNLTDAYLLCNGLQLNLGSGTITRGILINPGTITATGGNTALTQASAGQIQIGTTIGNTAGTSTMGVTEKKGSGAGNYTTTNASYADVDGTNLAYTVTVPSGWKALVTFVAAISTSAGGNQGVAITDGTIVLKEQIYSISTSALSVALSHVFTGDGASHTFKVRWSTSAGTATLYNATATQLPALTITLMPSN